MYQYHHLYIESPINHYESCTHLTLKNSIHYIVHEISIIQPYNSYVKEFNPSNQHYCHGTLFNPPHKYMDKHKNTLNFLTLITYTYTKTQFFNIMF